MVFPIIVGFLASAGAAIASSVATIGTAVSSFAATIAPTLGSILTTLKTYAEPLAKFANTFLQLLDILKPGERIDDMGDRALQAADKGITLDKFEKFDDYMNALRKFELDPEQSAKNSPEAKLVAGLGISTIGVEDKFNAQRGSLNALWLLPLVNSGYFTPEKMQVWLAAGKLGGDIFAYLDKRQSGGEARSFEKALENGPKDAPMSGVDKEKLYEALDSARAQWAEITRKMKDNDHSQGA